MVERMYGRPPVYGIKVDYYDDDDDEDESRLVIEEKSSGSSSPNTVYFKIYLKNNQQKYGVEVRGTFFC